MGMCLDIAVSETVNISKLTDLQEAESLVTLGALKFTKFHRWEAAIYHFKQALVQDPTNVDARFWLSICFCHYQDYDKAEMFLTQALELDPKRADCLSLMADFVWDRYHFLEKSLSYLMEATKISPDWPKSRVELIRVLFNLGRFQEARQEIDHAMGLLDQPITIPKNEIEHYYEKNITGKSWIHLNQKLNHLKLLVQ